MPYTFTQQPDGSLALTRDGRAIEYDVPDTVADIEGALHRARVPRGTKVRVRRGQTGDDEVIATR